MKTNNPPSISPEVRAHFNHAMAAVWAAGGLYVIGNYLSLDGLSTRVLIGACVAFGMVFAAMVFVSLKWIKPWSLTSSVVFLIVQIILAIALCASNARSIDYLTEQFAKDNREFYKIGMENFRKTNPKDSSGAPLDHERLVVAAAAYACNFGEIETTPSDKIAVCFRSVVSEEDRPVLEAFLAKLGANPVILDH